MKFQDRNGAHAHYNIWSCWVKYYYNELLFSFSSDSFYCRNLYTHKGKLLEVDDKLKNPELAETLQVIADAGNADPFYEGVMAGIIVDDVKKKGGILTLEDLKSYKAISKEPLKSKLGFYTVLNTPPTASGPVLALILNILKGKNRILQTLFALLHQTEAENVTTKMLYKLLFKRNFELHVFKLYRISKAI